MKAILIFLFTSLFLIVSGGISAQETDDKDDSQNIITGNVSTSEFYFIPTNDKHGEIQLMQMQNGVEVRAELHWGYTNICLWFNCWMQGKGITRFVYPVGTPSPASISVCARVASLIRNGANVASGSGSCGYIFPSQQVEEAVTWQGDPRSASWAVTTIHSVHTIGFSWEPTVQSSANL